MLELIKLVNALLVDPEVIATIRMKLNPAQREAASSLDSGVNTLFCYEFGRTKLLLRLVKLLNGHPDLLAEVRAA